MQKIKMSKKFNFSVIIPHKNSLNSLNRALNSIPYREDVQIIIVDNSPIKISIKSDVKTNHKNLLLIYSDPIKGAGHARNIGIKNSNSQWILFLDSDDYFTYNAFDNLEKYIQSNYDLIFFSPISENLKNDQLCTRHIPYVKLINNYLKHNDNSIKYNFSPPWSKLIKRKLIISNDIYFDEINVSNDVIFSMLIGYHANKIKVTDDEIYCITEGDNSLTKIKTIENFRIRFDVVIRKYNFLNSKKLYKYRPYILSRLLSSLKFGFFEFIFCLKKIMINRVNIFLGLHRVFMFSNYKR